MIIFIISPIHSCEANTGLDTALVAKAFERPVEIIIYNQPNAIKKHPLNRKLKNAQELGIPIHFVADKNSDFISSFKHSEGQVLSF